MDEASDKLICNVEATSVVGRLTEEPVFCCYSK